MVALAIPFNTKRFIPVKFDVRYLSYASIKIDNTATGPFQNSGILQANCLISLFEKKQAYGKRKRLWLQQSFVQAET
jgi:hypothetical protein